MNLLLFTIEVERDPGADHGAWRGVGVGARPTAGLAWVALAIVGLVCVVGAAFGGWLIAGGNPTAAGLPDWLELGALPVSASGGPGFQINISSEPSGASAFVDGHQLGTTPLAVNVAPGQHVLVLKHRDTLDEQQQLQVHGDLNVDVSLWRRRPNAVQLRPAYPGATIRDAAFLADGHVAISMSRPRHATDTDPRALSEGWILDPTSGDLAPFEADAMNPRSPVLAVSPDGHRIAYLRPGDQSVGGIGSAPRRLEEVWVSSSDAETPPTRVFSLAAENPNSQSPPAGAEALLDVAWTPDGQHLLITAELLASGGYSAASRSRLLLVNASPDVEDVTPMELAVLPAEVIARSYSWAPDGHWVVFLTEAKLGGSGARYLALCGLDTSAGGSITGFRYVADLGGQTDPSNILPVAAVAWSPASDGRLVFAAPTPKIAVSNLLGLPGSTGGEVGLFVATPSGPALGAEEGRRLGTANDLIAPAWRGANGPGGANLVVLARSDRGSKPLVVRSVDPSSGTVADLGVELPARVGSSGTLTARWDLAHGRMLVIARRRDSSAAGQLEYWLLQLQGQG